MSAIRAVIHEVMHMVLDLPVTNEAVKSAVGVTAVPATPAVK